VTVHHQIPLIFLGIFFAFLTFLDPFTSYFPYTHANTHLSLLPAWYNWLVSDVLSSAVWSGRTTSLRWSRESEASLNYLRYVPQQPQTKCTDSTAVGLSLLHSQNYLASK